MEFLKRNSETRSLGRKSFIVTSIGLIAATVVSMLKFPKKENDEKNAHKFLTHDGKLVQIDMDKLPSAKRVVDKSELQNWIKR